MSNAPICPYCNSEMNESSGGGFWVCEYPGCPKDCSILPHSTMTKPVSSHIEGQGLVDEESL